MIEKAVSRLPNSITRFLKGTFIERYYYNYRIDELDFIYRDFSTECGQFTIAIPSYADEWYFSSHEPMLNSALSKTLTDDSVFYDIGSQFGYHLQFAINCGVKESDIHSFEVDKLRYAILSDNFDNINLVNKKVGGDSEGELAIDEYCESNKAPDVIKIDVEGAEGGVIAGMSNTLDAFEPTIFIEVHPKLLSDFGYKLSDLYYELEDIGYDITITNHRDKQSKWFGIEHRNNINTDTFLLRGRAR
jgi:hypothetical protein